MSDRRGDKLDRFLDKLDQAISSEDAWVGSATLIIVIVVAVCYV